MSARDDLVVDIEVVPATDWPDLDEPTRMYLVQRSRDHLIRDGTNAEHAAVTAPLKAEERLALELGAAKVVAIGLCNVRTGNVAVLLEQAGDAVPTAPVAMVGTEAEVLQRFWEWALVYGRLVTMYGRTFDGPALHVRSAQLGVPCSRMLVPYRYDLSDHCDLAEVLNFQGSVRSNYSLAYWCARFGITSPKVEGIDGSAVAGLYREGRLLDIAEYVARDVVATRELYLRLRASFAHLFKGGPAIAPLPTQTELVA